MGGAPMPRYTDSHRDVITLSQKTVAREVSFAGPGLFSGETATLTFSPAGPDSGITFVREQGERVDRVGPGLQMGRDPQRGYRVDAPGRHQIGEVVVHLHLG